MCRPTPLPWQLTVLVFWFLVPSLAAGNERFTGRVVVIMDGDTIRVMHNDRAEKVRIFGIDCPEWKQPFSRKARAFTSSMAFGKDVIVAVQDTDEYGRTVGRVLLPDGRELGKELVKAGFAWWYRKYDPDDAELEELEKEARSARRGLWQDPKPVAPWEWRQKHRTEMRRKSCEAQ